MSIDVGNMTDAEILADLGPVVELSLKQVLNALLVTVTGANGSRRLTEIKGDLRSLSSTVTFEYTATYATAADATAGVATASDETNFGSSLGTQLQTDLQNSSLPAALQNQIIANGITVTSTTASVVSTGGGDAGGASHALPSAGVAFFLVAATRWNA
jgi:hypothetical protein